MKKSYTDELGAWVRQRAATRPRQDRNLVAFLAVRSDVVSAVAAGYKLKTIWAHLHEVGRIPYCYVTFLRHVRRHLAADTRAVRAKHVARKALSDAPQLGARASAHTCLDAFNFNATPRQEDLI